MYEEFLADLKLLKLQFNLHYSSVSNTYEFIIATDDYKLNRFDIQVKNHNTVLETAIPQLWFTYKDQILENYVKANPDMSIN